MRQFTLVCALLTAGSVLAAGAAHAVDPLPVFDAHLHYSHDAWEVVSPKEVVGQNAQGRRQARSGVELE